MRGLLPTLLALTGCGFHRPTFAPLEEHQTHAVAATTPRNIAAEASADAHGLPTTTYHVVATDGAAQREWLVELRPAAGDELSWLCDAEPHRHPNENDSLLVCMRVTPATPGAEGREHKLWSVLHPGSGVWAMALELERMRGVTDALTATRAILADDRAPLTGVSAIVDLGLALSEDPALSDAILANAPTPSLLDLWRAYRLADADGFTTLRECVTLQPEGAQAIDDTDADHLLTRQRMALDITLGSTHLARLIVDATAPTMRFDLSRGIARVVIQHPQDPGKQVRIERVRPAACGTRAEWPSQPQGQPHQGPTASAGILPTVRRPHP